MATMKSKQIFIRVKGGLGNQLFQFAMWLRIKQLFPDAEVKLEVAQMRKGSRSLILAKFFPNAQVVHLPWLSLRLAKYARRFQVNFLHRIGLHPLWLSENDFASFEAVCERIKDSGNCLIDGYWQQSVIHRPVIDELRLVFQSLRPNQSMSLEMQELAQNSVAVHVRLDDYLLPENQLIFHQLSTAYFLNGIGALTQNDDSVQLVIFSDAPERVLEVHPDLEKFDYVFANQYCRDYIEEFLWMKDFQRLVISNSTFSYWASLLGSQNESMQRIFPKEFFQDVRRNQRYLDGENFIFSENVQLMS